MRPADTTTTAFVGPSRRELGVAAEQFFAHGGTRLYVAGELPRLDGLDVSLLAWPGGGVEAIEAAARYCERRGDCFLVADAAPEQLSSSFVAVFPPPSAAAAGQLAARRATAIFIESSIDKGTRWAVFEPNEEPLWAELRRCISEFLGTSTTGG